MTHGVVGPIAQIQEPLQLVRAAEADLLVDTDGQPPLLVELPIRLQNILEVVVGDEVEVVRVDLHDPLGGSLQTGGFQNVLDLLHRIALPAALDAHGGIFTDVAVGQTVGAEVHGLLGGGLPLVPQAGQLQRHRVHAHDMAAGPLQKDRHIGGDGVQIVAVGDLVGIRPVDLVEIAADDPAVGTPHLLGALPAHPDDLFIGSGIHQIDAAAERSVEQQMQMGIRKARQHQSALQVNEAGLGVLQRQDLLVAAQTQDHTVLDGQSAYLGIGLVQRVDDAVVKDSIHRSCSFLLFIFHALAVCGMAFFTIRPS